MATTNLTGLSVGTMDIAVDNKYSKQLRNNNGIPVLMADSIAVSYTTSSITDEDGITKTVANFTTLDEKLPAMDASIAA